MSIVKHKACVGVLGGIVVGATVMLWIVGCGGGGGVAALIGGAGLLSSIGLSSSPVVGVSAVFLGERNLPPAAVLPFTSEARAIGVTQQGDKIIVTDTLHNTISIINPDTRKVTSVLDVRTNPKHAALTPDGKKAYVSSFGLEFQDSDLDVLGQTITVVDMVDEKILDLITVAPRPGVIIFTPDGKKAYVAHAAFDLSNTDKPGIISIIDVAGDTVIGQVELTRSGVASQQIEGLAISRDGQYLYALGRRTAGSGNGSVSVIDTSGDEVLQIATVGAGPAGMALDPDSERLFVSNQSENTVSVFDVTTGTASEINRVSVADTPGPVVVSPDGQKTYVAHIVEPLACPTPEFPEDPPPESIGQTVSVLDTATGAVIPGKIEVGRVPMAMVITPDSTKLYVISACEEKLSSVETKSIVSGASLTANFTDMQARAVGIAISEQKPEAYVLHPHAVSVVDTGTDKVSGAVIPVRGDGPTQLIAGSPDVQGRFKLYAMHPGAERLSVVAVDNDGFQSSGVFDLESRPSHMVFSDLPEQELIITLAGFSNRTDFSDTLDRRIARLSVQPFGVDDLLSDTPIEVELGPIKAVADPAKKRIFVAAFGQFFSNDRDPSGKLSRVDLDAGEATDVGGGSDDFVDLVADTDKGSAYLAAFRDIENGRIQSIDLGADVPVLTELTTEVNRPVSLAFSDPMLYVADYAVVADKLTFRGFDVNDINNSDQNFVINISGVNPSKIVLAALGGENAAILLQAGDRSYVCNENPQTFCDIGSQVNIINLATQSFESVAVGSKPVDAVVSQDKIFVSGYFSSTVTVIDATTIDFNAATPPSSRTLVVGKGPSSLVEVDGKVFVANSIDNTISVILAEEPFSQVSVIETISL